MKRRHCFELHELSMCPAEVRNSLTDILQFSIRFNRIYAPAAKLLGAALKRTGARRVIDLCSGAGGPWAELHQELSAQTPVSLCLTDKFPNAVALNTLCGKRKGMAYSGQSVDATELPQELDGFRTLFSSFHHFTPEQARNILADAVKRKQGVAIFEFTRRDWRAILLMLLSPVMALMVVPFLRPFRWSRLFWTYILPMIPLVLTFDGVVSCLRTYSQDELKTLTADFQDYDWDIGEMHGERWAVPVTYLIGWPKVYSLQETRSSRRTLQNVG